MEAVGNGHHEIVDLLIKAGATVSAQDRDEFYPLTSAAMDGHKGIVELLLNKCNVNVHDPIECTTALMCPIKHKYNNIAEMFKSDPSISLFQKPLMTDS